MVNPVSAPLPVEGDPSWFAERNLLDEQLKGRLNDLVSLVENGRLSTSGLTAELTTIAASLNPQVLSDTFMALQISNPGSQSGAVIRQFIPPAVADVIANDPTVAQEAANLAQSDALLLRSELLEVPDNIMRMLFAPIGAPERMRAGFETVDPTVGLRWGVGSRNPVTGKIHLLTGRYADGTRHPQVELPVPTPTPVTIHGDSLTAGWVSSTAGLATLLGRAVTARGNGGHTSRTISARQGGEPMRLGAFTIPASGAVNVSLTFAPSVAGSTAANEVPSFTGSYFGEINGVAGTLEINGSGAGAFTRLAAGRVTAVLAGTPFQTGDDPRSHRPILWAGRNNFKAGAADAEQVVRDLRRMMDYTTQKQYAIILSIPPWVGETIGSSGRVPLDLVNNAIRDAFPAQFLDASALLRSEQMLAAVGLTPTTIGGQSDLDNIAQGVTPVSFRSTTGDGSPDSGHLNAKGYEALNLIIAEYYAARGWMEN